MDFPLLNVIEEQVAVEFTGKVNVLSRFNHQYLGHLLFKGGEIIQVIFQPHEGLKAFYHLLIQEYSLNSFDYVVEPEIVEDKERRIHYPWAVLKNKMAEVLKQHREAQKLRPPENVRIVADGSFLKAGLSITPEEFDVLKTLSEWNSPFDIYQQCQLLDHEITLALVSLRKKNALKIMAGKT